MSSLKIPRPQNQPEEEALGRIETLLHKLKHDKKDKVSDVKDEWAHNTGHFHFTALRFDLSGVIKVYDGKIDIHTKIPMTVYLFKNKIKQVIEGKAKEILA